MESEDSPGKDYSHFCVYVYSSTKKPAFSENATIVSLKYAIMHLWSVYDTEEKGML